MRSSGPSNRQSELRRALSTPEQTPLGGILEDGFDETQAPRFWRVVERRLQQRSARIWKGLGVSAVAFSLALLVWLWFGRLPSSGALNLASGQSPSVMLGTSREPVSFSDGSEIALSTDSRLEVLRNDGRSFVTVLRRGRGTFDIKPGGPRRWVVEAGLASIEVVGTRFSVTREPGAVRVRVERGVVRVVGESLPDGARQLTAGQSLEVVLPEQRRSSQPEASARSAGAAVAGAPSAIATEAPRARASSSADKAPERVTDDLDARLAAADAARRRGDTASAIRYLEEIVQRAPEHDARRGMAALSLARLSLESDPARAARALDLSMSSMPAALAEDALARLIEAEARAGRTEQAARLAEEYQQRFPAGHRAHDVKRWLTP